MPHMPPWHMPEPHIPFPHSESDSDLAADAECAANLEYCVVRWFCPQEGQRIAFASAVRRTSCSNFVPQSSHEYSKIGIPLAYRPAQRRCFFGLCGDSRFLTIEVCGAENSSAMACSQAEQRFWPQLRPGAHMPEKVL